MENSQVFAAAAALSRNSVKDIDPRFDWRQRPSNIPFHDRYYSISFRGPVALSEQTLAKFRADLSPSDHVLTIDTVSDGFIVDGQFASGLRIVPAGSNPYNDVEAFNFYPNHSCWTRKDSDIVVYTNDGRRLVCKTIRVIFPAGGIDYNMLHFNALSIWKNPLNWLIG